MNDIGAYLVAGLTALAAIIVGVWRMVAGARKSGKQAQKGKQAEKVLERVDEAQKSRRNSDNLSDDEAIERMRKRADK